jgi:hypothetical protein
MASMLKLEDEIIELALRNAYEEECERVQDAKQDVEQEYGRDRKNDRVSVTGREDHVPDDKAGT